MLHFTKPIAASGTAPSLRVIIDDYFITELPIPMPDDKGLLFTTMKIKPQNVKVISVDTDYHCCGERDATASYQVPEPISAI